CVGAGRGAFSAGSAPGSNCRLTPISLYDVLVLFRLDEGRLPETCQRMEPEAAPARGACNLTPGAWSDRGPGTKTRRPAVSSRTIARIQAMLAVLAGDRPGGELLQAVGYGPTLMSRP